MPAIPEPNPKVNIFTRSGLIPIKAAICEFCVTARVSNPRRVRFIINRNNARKISARTKMAMRIKLMDTTSLIIQAPPSQSGEVSGRACVPNIFLAICWRAIEIPKVAKSVSRGRLYNHRITKRSMATPAQKVTAKAVGTASKIDKVSSGTICCNT